jgi:hypothetical protein
MVLIEMHMSNPTHSAYTWARGQVWPVPPEEDEFVTRIEVFGPEYELTENLLPGGRVASGTTYPDGMHRQLKDWLPHDAPYISQLMRMHIATGAIK